MGENPESEGVKSAMVLPQRAADIARGKWNFAAGRGKKSRKEIAYRGENTSEETRDDPRDTREAARV